MTPDPKLNSTGMVLGKFMPPHRGHQLLIDFAQNFAEKITVIVGSLKSEPIPGELRYKWMRELFPDLRVVHLTDENPQEPHEHPNFWQIWHDSIRKFIPSGPDYIFASEDYGIKLGEMLGAKYIPVNHARDLIPISATTIRNKLYDNWHYLPACVRAHFVKRICVFGPESTGKSTLAKKLAEHYNTVYAHEFARELIELQGGECSLEDMPIIARGQIAVEEALARQANKILFCDTDVLTTRIWSELLFNTCPDWIKKEAQERHYDLYLLTDIDVPWIEDKARFLPNERESFMARCEKELSYKNVPFVKLRGTLKERFKDACTVVNKVFSNKG